MGFRSYGTSMFNLEELPNCFPKLLDHFISPPEAYEDSNFPISSQTLVIIFYYIQTTGREVVSHCHFDLYFSDG